MLFLLGFAALPALARDGARSPEGRSVDEVLIIGRAARSTELATLGVSATHCGQSPIVETLEEIRGWWPGYSDKDAIRMEVEWWFGGTDLLHKNVLLFGGWTRQAEFQQFCEIETWYVYVGDLALPDGLTASDQPYGDIDLDGHWDVPIARLVTRNATETDARAQAWNAYFDQAHNQEWQTQVAVHCEDRSIWQGALPERARELSLQVPGMVGGNFVADPVILSSEHADDWNEQVLPNALAAGKAVIVAGPSVVSDPADWLCFNPWDYHFSQAPANSKWPLMLGYSCEIARFQEYWEASDDWCPYCRDYAHVTDYSKGPIAMMGPTCGSHQYINFWLAQFQLPALMQRDMDFGHSLLYATNTVGSLHPEAEEALLAYACIGPPWLKLHRTMLDPADVAEQTATSQLRLAIAPNPAHIGQGVTIDLNNPLRSLSGAMVIDPAGRVVRSFTALQPGRTTWDLRDNGGRPIPSGVYFLRVPGAAGSEPARKTIVVVR
jgi:hypothetical protein